MQLFWTLFWSFWSWFKLQFYPDTVLLSRSSWLFWHLNALFLLLFWLLWESLQFCPSFFLVLVGWFFFSLLRLHCQLFHAADRSRCHLGFSCASNKKLRGEEIGSFYPLQCTFLLEEMRGRAISPLCKFDFTNRRVGMDWVIGKDSSK